MSTTIADLRQSARLAAPGFAAFVAVAVWSILHESVVLDGVRTFWLDDDQMIAMRYARNLARGLGPVWNVGERVEGYSSPLWMAVMAVVHLLPLTAAKTALAMKFINMALVAALLVATLELGRRLKLGPWTRVGLGVAAALVVDVTYWAVQGFETTLITLLVTISFCGLASPLPSPRWTFGPAALLLLVRIDTAPLFAALCLIAASRWPLRSWVPTAVAALLPAMALHAWRWGYYGDLLPNTYYLKTLSWRESLGPGVWYWLRFASHYPLAVLAVAWAAWRRSPGGWLAIAVGLNLAAVLAVGGDVFPHARFIAPLVPAMLAVALATAGQLHRLGPALLMLLSLALAPGFRPQNLASTNGRPRDSVIVGVAIDLATDPSSSVAVLPAGQIPYFSDRPAVDLLGKSDRAIARLKPRDMPVGSGWTEVLARLGHRKFDIGLSLTSRPDLVVTHLPYRHIASGWLLSPEGQAAAPAYVRALLTDPTFLAEYRPFPVQNHWLEEHCSIFVHRDSREVTRRGGWTIPEPR